MQCLILDWILDEGKTTTNETSLGQMGKSE